MLRLLLGLGTRSIRVSAGDVSLPAADPWFAILGCFQMLYSIPDCGFHPIPVHVQLTLMKRRSLSTSTIDSSVSRAFPYHEWLFREDEQNSLPDQHSLGPEVAMYIFQNFSLRRNISWLWGSDFRYTMAGFDFFLSDEHPLNSVFLTAEGFVVPYSVGALPSITKDSV